jgi:hypothetical protein
MTIITINAAMMIQASVDILEGEGVGVDPVVTTVLPVGTNTG